MNEYTKILDVVAAVALKKQLDPEELMIIIMEGAYLNCPEIYQAISRFCEDGIESIE